MRRTFRAGGRLAGPLFAVATWGTTAAFLLLVATGHIW